MRNFPVGGGAIGFPEYLKEFMSQNELGTAGLATLLRTLCV